MAVRPGDVYRGKHKKRYILTIVLFIAAVLIVGAVVLFYSFQKYIVYGQNGISLELPILATPAPTDQQGGEAQFPTVDAELVIDQPDYSGVAAVAGEDTSAMRALFVPAERITAEGIEAYRGLMDDYGANALVLEMRPDSGQLPYVTSSSTASSYGLGGTLDMTDIIASLKEQGVYLAAQISCCVDNLLASRNSLVTLKNAYGAVYSDLSGNLWLDPYSAYVREYALELATELSSMGFDEIIFKNLSHPATEQGVIYSQQLSFTPTPLSAVSGFALSLTKALSSEGAALSVILDAEAYHGDKSGLSGQDPELLFKIFDRVCCWADSAWQYGADLEALSPFVTLGDASARFAPISSYAFEDAGSWIVRVPDGVLPQS